MPRTASTTARGYGNAHQKLRARYKPQVEAGTTNCYRCGRRIEPGTPWDLGHNDDRTAWTGPEHMTCNRSAGGWRGAAVVNGRPIVEAKLRTSRDW